MKNDVDAHTAAEAHVTPPRTHATFFAVGFHTSLDDEASGSTRTFGDDVALRLSQGLRETGHYARAPYCEDWGWCVEFEVLGQRHWLGVGPRTTVMTLLSDGAPGAAEDAPTPDWLCFVERSWSLRSLINPVRERQVTPEATMAVHSVLTAMPEVTGVLWHHQADFDAGDESQGAAQP